MSVLLPTATLHESARHNVIKWGQARYDSAIVDVVRAIAEEHELSPSAELQVCAALGEAFRQGFEQGLTYEEVEGEAARLPRYRGEG